MDHISETEFNWVFGICMAILLLSVIGFSVFIVIAPIVTSITTVWLLFVGCSYFSAKYMFINYVFTEVDREKIWIRLQMVIWLFLCCFTGPLFFGVFLIVQLVLLTIWFVKFCSTDVRDWLTSPSGI